MEIDVETIFAMKELKKKINSLSLKDIDFYYKGKKVFICGEGIKDWELTGLTNIDFINSYEKDITEKLTAGNFNCINCIPTVKYRGGAKWK